MRVTFLVHAERLEAVRLQQAQTTGKEQQKRKATHPSITSRVGEGRLGVLHQPVPR